MKTMKKGIIPAGILAAIAGTLALIAILLPKLQVAPSGLSLGSVTVGNEYTATTTSGMVNSPIGPNGRVIKTGSGALGSVILASTGLAGFTLYDATTTNILLRNGNAATSSILIADFPAAATIGTYTFDTTFNHGLLLATTTNAAIMGTTTITWR